MYIFKKINHDMNFSVDMNIIDNYSFQINGMSDTEYEYLFYKKKKKKKKKKK